MFYKNICELIGKTPVVQLNKINSNLFVKLESFNPCASVKDRIALAMIEDAEKKGTIKPGDTLVEPTSGNTGIGLAMVCCVKGYNLILTMPESMTLERRKILKALGAELVLTPKEKGMKGAIEEANRLSTEKGYFQPQQFDNLANPEVHRTTTATEIIEDMKQVDIFVSGIGTGGTITGVGEVLKKHNASTMVVAVEPFESPVLSGGKPGPHRIQGIGAGFVPSILNTKIYDRIIQVKADEAINGARMLARKEGILVGISSGASFHAAFTLANEFPTKKILVILPDTGERYLSTDLFDFAV